MQPKQVAMLCQQRTGFMSHWIIYSTYSLKKQIHLERQRNFFVFLWGTQQLIAFASLLLPLWTKWLSVLCLQCKYVSANSLVGSARHIAPLGFGRPEFESRLEDLSRSHPPSLSPTSLPVYILSYHTKGKNKKIKCNVMVYIKMSLCTHPEYCIIVMVMWSINILSCSDQKLWNGKYEAEMGVIHTSIEHPKDEPRGIKCRNPGWR